MASQPIESVSEHFTVEITAYEDLAGIGVSNGKKFTFPYAKIGDQIEFDQIQIKKKKRRKKNFIQNQQWTKRTQRIPDLCTYFSQCGGCYAQQIPYGEQFQLKIESWMQGMQNFYQSPRTSQPDTIFQYRNRMDFITAPGPLVGLHVSGSFRRYVDIEECKIQSNEANEILRSLRGLLIQFPDIVRDRKAQVGFLKYATIRYGFSTGDVLLILTFCDSFRSQPIKEYFIEKLCSQVKVPNLIFCYTRELSEVSSSGPFEVIRGNSHYTELLMGQTFEIPFDSFFQPNPRGFLPILEFIASNLSRIQNKNCLLDLFCGSGFFSRIFGQGFDEILALDFVESAVGEANKNLSIQFPEVKKQTLALDLYSEKTGHFIESLQSEHQVLIVDPPRRGLEEKLCNTIISLKPESIFYVSCSPMKQIQDIERLNQNYEVLDAMITDPYPHTRHLESVVFLQKR